MQNIIAAVYVRYNVGFKKNVAITTPLHIMQYLTLRLYIDSAQ